MQTVNYDHEPEVGPDARAPTRWGQDRRLEFVDFRLRWDGRLNRGDLTNFFGISVPQASLDIAKYLEQAPDNAKYDKSSRVYVAGPDFKPLFPGNEPARYLNELLARATGVLQQELSFLGWLPTVGVVPTPNRTTPVNTLLQLLGAIRQRKSLRVLYQSMSSPQPSERTIGPHAIAHDGMRWHVRAYCHQRRDYRDFVFARFLGVNATDQPGCDGSDDAAWHLTVPLLLAPNPELSPAKQRVIELDYGMTDGMVTIECRQALLFYALQRLGLLEDACTVRPEAQQVVLRNREEIAQHLPKSSGPR